MKYHNILIVKLSAIGDVIHALPVSRALKQAYPTSRLTWIVEKPAYDLLTNNPDIDEIVIFEKNKFRSPAGILHHGSILSQRLKRMKFDLALDLQGLFKSAAVAWMSGAPKRLGYCNMRELSWLVSRPVCGENRDGHVVERYLDVARALGCRVDRPKWIINAPDEDKIKAAALLRQAGLDIDSKYVVIAPGTNWESKCWPTESYADLADHIWAEYGLPIIVVGASKDKGLAADIKQRSQAKVFDLTGQTTLKQLAVVLQHSALFIGGDTGPMHLAVAMGTPVVALFGPTDPNRNGPYGDRNIVVRSSAACAPCFKRTCEKMECMREISPADVFQAVKKMDSLRQ